MHNLIGQVHPSPHTAERGSWVHLSATVVHSITVAITVQTVQYQVHVHVPVGAYPGINMYYTYTYT